MISVGYKLKIALKSRNKAPTEPFSKARPSVEVAILALCQEHDILIFAGPFVEALK